MTKVDYRIELQRTLQIVCLEHLEKLIESQQGNGTTLLDESAALVGDIIFRFKQSDPKFTEEHLELAINRVNFIIRKTFDQLDNQENIEYSFYSGKQ